MPEILYINGLNPGKLRKQFDKTVEELASGNFAAAEVKKMAGTPFYRARLDLETRLLFPVRQVRWSNFSVGSGNHLTS